MINVILLLCFISTSDSVMDLTMISNVGHSSNGHSNTHTLTCVSGERNPKLNLEIKKDDKIIRYPEEPKFKVTQVANVANEASKVIASGFHNIEHAGIFHCRSSHHTVTFVSNLNRGMLVPAQLSMTANKGDTVELVTHIHKTDRKEEITWKHNGNFYSTTHVQERVDNTARLTLNQVTEESAGIYSANFIGESLLFGAIMRLIVRACPGMKWGLACDQDCPECLNGGVCHDKSGDCICPPGFMGMRCETACREGKFGHNCQESCNKLMNCKGLSFCLLDPYGCSCASGWHGALCNEKCSDGMYGADCRLRCDCKNGGTCNPYSGCQCQTGWRGQHCEKSEHAPRIIEMDDNLEWNLHSSPKLTCSATGNPPPRHMSIVLRKLDSTELQPIRTTTDSNKSTAHFEIPRLQAEHGGLWECRVSTNGGQDSRKFNLTVKEPPCPTTPPTLLEKGSKQLLVKLWDAYRGDGPITSTKVLYKRLDSTDLFSSFSVYNTDPISLMHLQPSTRYLVQVQLSRPGEGGEGTSGPEAIMKTDCPEPTARPKIDFRSLEGRNATVKWSLPQGHGSATGFLVEFYGPTGTKLWEKHNMLSVHSIDLHNLEYHQDYRVIVRLVNCGSLGPASKPYILRVNSQGPSSPQNIRVDHISFNAVRVQWQPPVDPNGGIIKYTIEYQPVGQKSVHLWVDTEDGNKTTKDITALNGSTHYQFRVRAFSKVPGEWSAFVEAPIQGDGTLRFTPTTQEVMKPGGDSSQLLVAVVGSVTVTCVTILLALVVLFCIRKSLLKRRRTFTYQSGSALTPRGDHAFLPVPAQGEETILQFNSGTLTLTRRPKPNPEPLTYPILEWDDIKFEDVIGEGNFGQVIKAMIKNKDGNKMSAAIKMLKEFASENDHRDFAGELEVLCKLGQHPNIINLIGACENRGYLYIAIEYAPYGNLLDFLRKSRVLETDPAFAKEHGTASTLTSQQLLQFAVDVANGMHYLSDKQFIHRDLAARNVLVGENLVAKIADFGLSRGEEVYVKKTMGRLPVRWMAIESLNYSVYTTKSDVWSFGVLLWEIVSLGGTPYCGMTCAELYEKLPQGYRMEKPKNCDDEVYELMRQCWRDRPYERPPFQQISVQLTRMQEARKAYVNMALFENFTYAGIDATAEEA
ncbi:tyrosine-protein kinase receptor Tie-1 isoform X1 [Alosa sapidissima]|uniref:tyrosine-protein kinase receptor Tie-1 isoform X1 n=1 Tax=Alosa sapidissima TaxID=34773 RepID=UPI001C088ACF|nr:tyrosine-protein kinase receptor Tie-1 isoform X1 [Alosa sapidissima]